MKLTKKIGSILLVGAMLLSLSACGAKKAKKASADDFRAKLEEKGYQVADYTEFVTGEDDVKQALMAEGEDGLFTYYVFNDSKAASDYFNKGYDQMKEVKNADGFKGSLTKSGDKITMNATYSEDGESESVYAVCINADDMVLTCMANANDDATVKKIDEIINSLCY